MKIHTGKGLGDELMATALVREIKREMPDEMVRVRWAREELWRFNRWINYGNSDNGKILDMFSGHAAHWGYSPTLMGKHLGIKIRDLTPEVTLTDAERSVEYIRPDGRPVAGVDPTAGWISRRWPFDRWQEVASRLLDLGWRVVELGKRNLFPRPRIPHSESFLDRHTLRQTAAALSQMDLYLGNDSGLAFLAAAVGTPQVVLHSVVPGSEHASAKTVVIERRDICNAGCVKECEKSPQIHQREPECLKAVQPEEVVETAVRTLERFGRRA